jgi:tRNA dimethylallyltransferase
MEEHLSKSSNANHKHKVVVIMGATGCGKSRLAIDLAQRFPAEILNADSMQVYEGLDIVTNKVPVEERNGVTHHLLGTINSSINFTPKDFRDMAIPIIDSIISRKHLPIVVGGSNSYIQALVCSGDDDLKTSKRTFSICSNAGNVNDLHKRCDNDVQNISNQFDEVEEIDPIPTNGFCPNDFIKGSANDLHKKCDDDVRNTSNQFDQVEEIDPIATNGLHPNDFSKASANDLHKRCDDDVRNTSNQFDQVEEIDLIATNGPHPNDFSKGQKWDAADSFRYDCCFLWLDASLPVLDKFVEDRVDFMIEAGLLEEVSAFYDPKADYTHGLWQAIGLREFEEFFNAFPPEDNGQEIEKLDKGRHKILLDAAIEGMKTNTRQLVRRQKLRIDRLKTFFGWNLHRLDSTKALETSGSESLEHWEMMVVNISMDTVKRFLSEHACEASLKENVETRVDSTHPEQAQEFWTHACEACRDQVLQGAHEWEQHKLGRSHRRQIL